MRDGPAIPVAALFRRPKSLPRRGLRFNGLHRCRVAERGNATLARSASEGCDGGKVLGPLLPPSPGKEQRPGHVHPA